MNAEQHAAEIIANLIDEFNISFEVSERHGIYRELIKFKTAMKNFATHEPIPTSWQYPEQDGWPQVPGYYEIGYQVENKQKRGLIYWDQFPLTDIQKQGIYAWKFECAEYGPPPLVKGE